MVISNLIHSLRSWWPERRKIRRQPISSHVVLTYSDGVRSTTIPALIIDRSPFGVGLVHTEPLRIGTQATLISPTFNDRYEVVWSEKEQSEYHSGLRLLRLTKANF